MGTSTDGILYYGVELGTNDEICAALEISNFGDTLFLLEEALKEAGLEDKLRVDIHCCHDDPMYYLAAKQYLAPRGCPESLSGDALRPRQTWDAAIVRGLKVLGLKTTVKPGWVLASMWG